MATSELSTGKTIFVLTVVAGCFAVLWPKIFYPMFFGSPQYVSNLEKAQAQMRQERPPHMRPEMLHPALRENGRVIPHEHIVPRVEPDLPPRPVVKHPGSPKPGMGRPSFGGTGPHQAAKQGGGIMNLLMPMYTISIVAFFIYTMLRIWDPMILFIKLVLQFISNSSNNGPGTPSHDFYSGSTAEFRSSYYGEELCSAGGGGGRKQLEDGKTAGAGSEKTGPRLGWKDQDAKDVEMETLRRRLEATEAAMERLVTQMLTAPVTRQTLTRVTQLSEDGVRSDNVTKPEAQVAPQVDGGSGGEEEMNGKPAGVLSTSSTSSTGAKRPSSLHLEETTSGNSRGTERAQSKHFPTNHAHKQEESSDEELEDEEDEHRQNAQRRNINTVSNNDRSGKNDRSSNDRLPRGDNQIKDTPMDRNTKANGKEASSDEEQSEEYEVEEETDVEMEEEEEEDKEGLEIEDLEEYDEEEAGGEEEEVEYEYEEEEDDEDNEEEDIPKENKKQK